MRKTLLALILITSILPITILANETGGFPNPLEYETFGELIEAIISFIFTLSVAVVPLLIIIGAFYLITAGGDPKRIGTGKNIIIYTLIGLTIILLARGLLSMIESLIGVK